MRERARSIKNTTDFLITPTMYAPLETSLVLRKGTGAPTWSRATKAWGFNELGYLEELASGCAFFGGARLVRNLLNTTSENFSNAAWVKSNCTVTGTNTIVCANATSAQRVSQDSSGFSVTVGQTISCCYRVKKVTGGVGFVQIYCDSARVGSAYANFSLDDGSFVVSGCVGSSTLVATDTYDIRASFLVIGAGGVAPYLTLINAISSSRAPTFTGDGVKSFELLRAWSVDVTGRDASYIPEYVSVGSTVGKNFFLHTDDFSQSAWNKTNITVTQTAIANPVNGRVDAQKVEAASSASTSMYQSCTSAGLAAGNVFVVYAKAGSGSTDANRFVLRNSTTSTNLLWVTLNYSTGEITYVTGSDGASAVALSDGWWKITLVATSGVSDGNTLVGYVGFGGPSETAGEFLYAYRPYLGQGTTAPDVIPVVAGSWDPHGSGADGVKYFSTDYTKNRALTSLNGLRKESSATNALLWSRDLSNAAWSTKTNITAAKTATGLDGIANTATTLTATSTDAIILQPTSGIASADRCASAYVKRRTGTGTISFTQDGGGTWTDITSQINSSTWSRVQITSTLADPSVGFKISTSGDAIDVDCVQNEAGAEATSPIVTTTATISRNADSLTYQTASNWSDTAGTAYIEVEPYQWSVGGLIGSATNGLLESASDSGATAYDGTNSANGPTGTPSGRKKLAMRWGSGAMTVASGGSVGTPGTYDGGMGLASIGIAVNSSAYCNNVAIYTYAMTDAELQEVTK